VKQPIRNIVKQFRDWFWTIWEEFTERNEIKCNYKNQATDKMPEYPNTFYIWPNVQKHGMRYCLPQYNALNLTFYFQCENQPHMLQTISHNIIFCVFVVYFCMWYICCILLHSFFSLVLLIRAHGYLFWFL